MSDTEQHIYHCDRCNAVFSGAVPLPKETVCSECGEPPFRPMDFNSTEHLPKVVDENHTHGVPGQDVADFVSMQKVRRRQQGRWALVLWIGLLAVGGGIAAYNQMREGGGVVGKSPLEMKEQEYQESLRESGDAALKSYDSFLRAANGTSKSAYVLGGVGEILKMEAHAESAEAIKEVPPLSIIRQAFSDAGTYERIEFLAEDAKKQTFELVFWKKNGKWLLDWQQHVRYSEKPWSKFLELQPTGVSEQFRLYVRRRHVQSSKNNDALQLIFYKPSITPGQRSAESPQVELSSESPMYGPLKAAFEELANSDSESRVIGGLDKPGWLRVTANFSWQQGDEADEQKMVLDSIKSLHWLSVEPEG